MSQLILITLLLYQRVFILRAFYCVVFPTESDSLLHQNHMGRPLLRAKKPGVACLPLMLPNGVLQNHICDLIQGPLICTALDDRHMHNLRNTWIRKWNKINQWDSKIEVESTEENYGGK